MSAQPPIRLTIPADAPADPIALLHALGAEARRLTSPTGADPAEPYLTPAATQQLLEHMHRAKKKALEDGKA